MVLRTCEYCGMKHTFLTKDHIIPASKGGYSSHKNYAFVCGSCNSFKADLMPNIFILRIEEIINQEKENSEVSKYYSNILFNFKKILTDRSIEYFALEESEVFKRITRKPPTLSNIVRRIQENNLKT